MDQTTDNTPPIYWLTEGDVLADLEHIVEGGQSGDVSYAAAVVGGALRVTATDATGAARTFALYSSEVGEGE